jgi:hypothetical protein
MSTSMIGVCSQGRTEIVRELLKINKVGVNAQDTKRANIIVFNEPLGSLRSCVRDLRQNEVDSNVKGAHGNTRLIWADIGGHMNVLHDMVSTALDTARSCETFHIASCTEEHAISTVVCVTNGYRHEGSHYE